MRERNRSISNRVTRCEEKSAILFNPKANKPGMSFPRLAAGHKGQSCHSGKYVKGDIA